MHLYTPFIHLYSRTYTYVHPVYNHIYTICTPNTPLNTRYTPDIRLFLQTAALLTSMVPPEEARNGGGGGGSGAAVGGNDGGGGGGGGAGAGIPAVPGAGGGSADDVVNRERRAAARRIEAWCQAYRGLLNRWQLWHTRAKFDVTRAKVGRETNTNIGLYILPSSFNLLLYNRCDARQGIIGRETTCS